MQIWSRTMPATKQQQNDRLTAAKAIIAAHGGRATIDGQGAKAITAATNKQMAKELAAQFAHERMKPQTARQYIAKALRQLRGEVVAQKRGGVRDGGGRPVGSRKCQNCEMWNMAVSPNGETWQCSECGAIHPARVKFLLPGETLLVEKLRYDFGGNSAVTINWHLRYGLLELARQHQATEEDVRNALKVILQEK